jgi:hypothetical protein
MFTCAVLPDGGYLVGGDRALDTPSNNYPALLIRTDSMGDTLWTHTYQKISTEYATINTVAPLDNGHILIGAMSSPLVGTSGYYIHIPWFMILDSMGNIIKDTLYGNEYGGGGGAIYKDSLGGYFHTGQLDTLADPGNVNDYANFPDYIAHLDTDFRIQWITRFPYSLDSGHRYTFRSLQLQDGNYLIAGDAGVNNAPVPAWAAKIDRGNGNILWNHYYMSDTTHDAYFRNVLEKPDGSIVFTGSSFNDTLPAWHMNLDVWLVGVDSNGCEMAGCSGTTQVISPVLPAAAVNIWPNPTTGNIAISCTNAGRLVVYNIQGQQVVMYKVGAGATELQLPDNISAGVYICRYNTDEGNNMPTIVRLVYQP